MSSRWRLRIVHAISRFAILIRARRSTPARHPLGTVAIWIVPDSLQAVRALPAEGC
jgi:hypothetical protein